MEFQHNDKKYVYKSHITTPYMKPVSRIDERTGEEVNDTGVYAHTYTSNPHFEEVGFQEWREPERVFKSESPDLFKKIWDSIPGRE